MDRSGSLRVAEEATPLPPQALTALRGIEHRSGAFVLVSGGSREGRSAALAELEERASRPGWEVFRFRAHPLDAIVPYGVLQPWISQWYRDGGTPLTTPPSGNTSVSSGPYAMPMAGLIAGFFSEKTNPDRPEAPGPKRPSSDLAAPVLPALSPAALRSELVDLIEGRAREGPAVVLLEDANFLDPASWEWFASLGRRLETLPLAIVLTFGGELEPWAMRLGEVPTVLCPLSPDPAEAQWGDRLRQALKSLPPKSLDALVVAVLAGPDADRPLLREVLGVGEDALDPLLAPSISAGLLVRVGARYASPEPLLFPDLLGASPASGLPTVRRALAKALGHRAEQGHGSLLFRVGEHWAAAGDLQHGVPALVAAAREAERWGSAELAENRLLRAVLLAQGNPALSGREAEERCYAELATLRLRAGRQAEAMAAYERALAIAKERGTKVGHWGKYVAGFADAQAGLGGHPDALLRSTLAQVEGRAPDLEALLLRSLSVYFLDRARFPEATSTAERACELADQGRDRVLQVQCHSTAGRAHIYTGAHADAARAHLLKALEQRSALEGTADEVLIVGVLDALSLLECGVGDEPAALKWGEEALALARRGGYGTSFLWGLGNLSEEYIHVGDLAHARALLAEFQRLVERLEVPAGDSLSQQVLLLQGRLAAEAGESAKARDRFERIVEEGEHGGSRILLAQALVHLIVLSVRTHDPEGARRYTRQLERTGLHKTLMGETQRLLTQAETALRTSTPTTAPEASARSRPTP